MLYRRFGRTELQMPLITCGGMRFQHKWTDQQWKDIPREGQKNLEQIIAKAHESGINHIETARGYGSSEMQLGPILSEYDRDDWIIQTKVAPDPDPEVFLKNFDVSMSYLKQDFVDLLSIHGINDSELLEQTLRPGGCMDSALELQKQGRVRYIGFSTHANPGVIRTAIKSGYFSYINVHWYFVNEINWSAIKLAAANDMGVFIISPNDKGGKLYQPSAKLREMCSPLDPMIFNDLFCWSREEVHTLSMGAAKPSDFDEHLSALAKLEDSQNEMLQIEGRLRSEIFSQTGIEWTPGWDDGIPEWENVPEQINTREIVRLWVFAKALDMVEFGKFRYNLLGNAGHWFPGKKVSDFDDRVMIEAHEGCSFVDRIPEILKEAHSLLNAEEQKRLSQSD